MEPKYFIVYVLSVRLYLYVTFHYRQSLISLGQDTFLKNGGVSAWTNVPQPPNIEEFVWFEDDPTHEEKDLLEMEILYLLGMSDNDL